MTYTDLWEETLFAVTANKVRSGLTALGIVIGIAAVIAMVAIGQGTRSSVEDSIQAAGSNLIMVMPGGMRGAGGVNAGRGNAQTLTEEDANKIAALEGARAVESEVSRRYQLTARGTNTNTQVVGTVPAYAVVRNVSMQLGSFLTLTQGKNASKVVVLGPTVRDDLFGVDVDPTGQTVRINKVEFKVIGVTSAKGGSGFNNQDDMVFVPLATAQRYLGSGEYVSTIAVQATSQDAMADLQARITDLLLVRHKIADPASPDFSVLNQADLVATATSVTGTFTTLLAAIAAISLLVGGIGIMNMMLTTVTERTREIGLRKAVGAARAEITAQFLAEAVLLTVVGGAVGVALGWFVARVVQWTTGTAAEVSPGSVFLAFGVSALIGITFGYYPARRAARLRPIEALRYE